MSTTAEQHRPVSPGGSEPRTERSTAPDSGLADAFAGQLAALVGMVAPGAPESWISGAAASLALTARHVIGGELPVVSRGDVADGLYVDEIGLVLEALRDTHEITRRVVDRGGAQFLPEQIRVLDQQRKLIELFENALLVREASEVRIENVTIENCTASTIEMARREDSAHMLAMRAAEVVAACRHVGILDSSIIAAAVFADAIADATDVVATELERVTSMIDYIGDRMPPRERS